MPRRAEISLVSCPYVFVCSPNRDTQPYAQSIRKDGSQLFCSEPWYFCSASYRGLYKANLQFSIMCNPARFLFLGALWARVIRADFQVLQTGFLANESSVELSTGCVSALESSVTYDQWLQANAYDDYYGPMNDTVLDSLCPAGCKSSLASYRSSVVSSCQADRQPFQGLLAQYFVDLVIASYNFTCFKAPDLGQYCNSTCFQSASFAYAV